jgi:hypothetical protein
MPSYNRRFLRRVIFFFTFIIALLSLSVIVVNKPARFNKKIIPFKGVLNWLNLSINE